MRQLYDASAQVLATNRYDPYGSLMSHYGDATSAYAFTDGQFVATWRAEKKSNRLKLMVEPFGVLLANLRRELQFVKRQP